jgi:hypothetical protein
VFLDISKAHLYLPGGGCKHQELLVPCLRRERWPEICDQLGCTEKELCGRLINILKGQNVDDTAPTCLHEFMQQRASIREAVFGDARVKVLGRALDAAAHTTEKVRSAVKTARGNPDPNESARNSPAVREAVSRARFEFALEHLEGLTLLAVERFLQPKGMFE